MRKDELNFLREGEAAGEAYLLNVPNRLQRGLVGTQIGGGVGSSLEFLDHREYQPGDDIRHIDWQALARSDRLTVKLFREEIAPHVDIVFDASVSMALEGTQKNRATLGLIALLAKAAENAGFTCTPWKVGSRCERVHNGHLPPSFWNSVALDYAGDAGDILAKVPPTLQSRSLRILISDLLWRVDPAAIVRLLAYQGAAVLVVQILAIDELQPSFQGNVCLIDSETQLEEEIFLDQSVLARYRARLAWHQNSWMSACCKVGATFVTLIAEKFVEDWKPISIIERQFLSVV